MALAIDHEAVGEQGVVGCTSISGATGEQTGLEPTAMLIGAFQIKVSRMA